MFFKVLRATLGATAALLAGCDLVGGGGDGTPTLSLAPASITVEASSEDTNLDDVYIELTVAHLPRSGVFVAVESDGDAIELAEFLNPEGDTAFVRVVLKTPADAGAGEHHSTLTINVCSDEGCSRHIRNSP